MKHFIDLCMYSVFVKQSIFMSFDSISQNVHVIEAVSTLFIGVVKVESALVNALFGGFKEKNTYTLDVFAKKCMKSQKNDKRRYMHHSGYLSKGHEFCKKALQK